VPQTGKSTTIAGLVHQAQAAGMSVVIFDVEGEYTHLHQPTTKPSMLAGLAERKMAAAGLSMERMTVFHLVGREPANPDHPRLAEFSLRLDRLSPYAAMEILNLTNAQEQRFLKAYDIARQVLRDLNVFPSNADEEREAAEIDEFERGYPQLTLSVFMDVVGACPKFAERDAKAKEPLQLDPLSPTLRGDRAKSALMQRIGSERMDSAVSWRALLGRLGRVNRLKDFEAGQAAAMQHASLLKPGAISVIDLSDSGMSELNSIVIADMFTGIQSAQDQAYAAYEAARRRGQNAAIPRTLIIIEEAHEFLSEDRIDKTRILFQQVARIAKRGRKRWLGLAFVTQLAQHLPRQVLGLVNSFILHKISDPQVVASLRKTISGIDEGLWSRLPALAPGQAIASFPHMTRPLLVSVDPARSELRLAE
jgi:DNA helicase HerA-like ATPase